MCAGCECVLCVYVCYVCMCAVCACVLCVHVCICVLCVLCVHVHICACVHVCRSQRSQSSVSFYPFLLCFSETGSPTESGRSSLNLLCRLASEVWGSTCLCFSIAEIIHICHCTQHFYMRVGDPNLGSPACSNSRHLTAHLYSQSLQGLFTTPL